MPSGIAYAEFAHLIKPEQVETIDVLGPTIQFLTPPDRKDAPCIMRGTIPPGVSIPLHSHADPETFVAQLLSFFNRLREGTGLIAWIGTTGPDKSHPEARLETGRTSLRARCS
jgi:hypothetical protein